MCDKIWPRISDRNITQSVTYILQKNEDYKEDMIEYHSII